MNSSLSYDGLVQQIVKAQEIQEDFLVPSRQLKMEGDTHLSFGGTAYQMRDVAHEHVSQKLKIPKPFYERMGQHPELRTQVVNRLLADNEDRTHFVRTEGGEMRAMLSDRYKPIDHGVVLQSIVPTMRKLKDQYDLQVTSADMTEKRMYLQFAFPKLEAEIAVGDAVQYGLTISNSEVGFGMLKVSPTIWRLVCSNGMIRTEAVKNRHVGRQMEMGEDYSVLSDEAKVADMQAFRLKLRDTIEASMNEMAFHDWIDRMRDATKERVNSVTKTIKKITKTYSLNEEWEDLMIEDVMQNRNPNKWGIANAVTSLAHHTTNADTQYQVETLGSQIIDMTPAQWSAISA